MYVMYVMYCVFIYLTRGLFGKLKRYNNTITYEIKYERYSILDTITPESIFQACFYHGKTSHTLSPTMTHCKSSLQYLNFSSAKVHHVTWIQFHRSLKMRISPDTGGRLCHALHNPRDETHVTRRHPGTVETLPHRILHLLHPSYIPL